MNINFDGRIFMEDASGIAAASLGQIVEGYAVVFGRENCISLRSLEKDDQREFLHFVRTVRQRVEQHFGPTIMFEHGAACAGTNVSCGVNRIHVHVVPYTGRPLNKEIAKTFRCVATTSTIEQMLERLSSWETDTPYFWVEEGSEVFLFSYGEKRESQVVRRIIAQQVGMENRWNWREHPTQEAAEWVARELLTSVAPGPLGRPLATLV
jgi:diadenosine tetraphosphate (Ap4A) HIT family hydrolase